jgi:hypothetical protein
MATDAQSIHLERKERSAVIELPPEGKPYRRDDVMRMILSSCSRDDVEAFGQRTNSASWEVTFRTAAAKDAFTAASGLEVKGHEASVSSVKRSGYKMRVLYLPYYVPTEIITDVLVRCANAKVLFQRNEVDRNDGMLTNIRFIVVDTEYSERLPDSIKWAFDGEHGTAQINVAGRQPLCFRCNIRGHRRFQCQAPYCSHCRRVGHPEGDGCGRRSYANVTHGGQIDAENLDNEMDAEVAEGEDEGRVSTGGEQRGSGESATRADANNSDDSDNLVTDNVSESTSGGAIEASTHVKAADVQPSAGIRPTWGDRVEDAEKEETGALASAEQPRNQATKDEPKTTQLKAESVGFQQVSSNKRSLSKEKNASKNRDTTNKTTKWSTTAVHTEAVDPTARHKTAPMNPSATNRTGAKVVKDDPKLWQLNEIPPFKS